MEMQSKWFSKSCSRGQDGTAVTRKLGLPRVAAEAFVEVAWSVALNCATNVVERVSRESQRAQPRPMASLRPTLRPSRRRNLMPRVWWWRFVNFQACDVRFVWLRQAKELWVPCPTRVSLRLRGPNDGVAKSTVQPEAWSWRLGSWLGLTWSTAASGPKKSASKRAESPPHPVLSIAREGRPAQGPQSSSRPLPRSTDTPVPGSPAAGIFVW